MNNLYGSGKGLFFWFDTILPECKYNLAICNQLRIPFVQSRSALIRFRIGWVVKVLFFGGGGSQAKVSSRHPVCDQMARSLVQNLAIL